MQIDNRLPYCWNSNGFEVRLMQDRDSLFYTTVDLEKKSTVRREKIDLSETSLEGMISRLQRCRLIIEENGCVNFCQKYYSWDIDNKQVYLIHGENELIWEIFCTNTKWSSFHSFQGHTTPSLRCHSKTADIIENLKINSFTSIQSIKILINDFNIVRLLDYKGHKERYITSVSNEARKPNNQWQKLKITKYKIRMLLTILFFPIYEIPIVNHLSSFFFKITDLFFMINDDNPLKPLIIKVAKFLNLITASFHGRVEIEGVLEEKRPVRAPFLVIFLYCLYVSFRRRNSLKNKDEWERELEISPPEKPFAIELEPKITASSCIDPRVIVSKFTWAVTLISNGGDCGNHAEIILEGINDGFYDEQSPRARKGKAINVGEKFIYLAHFLPKIESGLISDQDLIFQARSKIWMIPCDKVKEMLLRIENEKTLPEGQRHKFNKLGESVLRQAHNCFTWARYHLKSLDIEFKEKKNLTIPGLIAACVKDYAKEPKYYNRLKPLQRI